MVHKVGELFCRKAIQQKWFDQVGSRWIAQPFKSAFVILHHIPSYICISSDVILIHMGYEQNGWHIANDICGSTFLK